MQKRDIDSLLGMLNCCEDSFLLLFYFYFFFYFFFDVQRCDWTSHREKVRTTTRTPNIIMDTHNYNNFFFFFILDEKTGVLCRVQRWNSQIFLFCMEGKKKNFFYRKFVLYTFHRVIYGSERFFFFGKKKWNFLQIIVYGLCCKS